MTSYSREVRKRGADETEKFPHPWVGIITFSNESEKGQRLIAGFVEDIWLGFRATEEIAASQAFGATVVKLFVSATTEVLVKEVIDETIGRIEGGFKKAQEPLHDLN